MVVAQAFIIFWGVLSYENTIRHCISALCLIRHHIQPLPTSVTLATTTNLSAQTALLSNPSITTSFLFPPDSPWWHHQGINHHTYHPSVITSPLLFSHHSAWQHRHCIDHHTDHPPHPSSHPSLITPREDTARHLSITTSFHHPHHHSTRPHPCSSIPITITIAIFL